MFYRFAQANWKESGPSVLDHFSLHVPCSVIHTAPYTDTGNDKGMTKQRHKRQMAQRVSAGKPSRVLMALSLLLWLFARREMVKRPGKCFTECFAVLVIWNIKFGCCASEENGDEIWDSKRVPLKQNFQGNAANSKPMFCWRESNNPTSYLGCHFARRPLQIAMQKQIQMWIRNGSTTCRCVMTSVKKAATSWNSWSCFFTQVTTVRKSTPWWMRQLGSLIFTLVSCLVWFFPVETAPVFFSHFFSGQAGHLKVKHGSQRGFPQLCPSWSLRIALMQGRKRSWVTYDERSKSCHMVFIGVHMVSIWVRDRPLFIPIPKFVRLSQMQGFQLFSSLENPLTRWWNTVNYSGPLWPPGHSGRFRRGLDHSDMGSASIGSTRCPAVPLTRTMT